LIKHCGFNVVDNIKQHVKGTIFMLLSHEPHLVAELLGCIVISLLIVAPKERLPNKVECILSDMR
jgi:hypothetical protein